MDLTRLLANIWPVLAVFGGIVILVIGAIVFWKRHKDKANRSVVKNLSKDASLPLGSSAKTVHAILFDGGIARELDVPIDLIQSSHPLFPREMNGKKVIFIERIIPEEPLAGTIPQPNLGDKDNGDKSKGNGSKDLSFLGVLGQKPTVANPEAAVIDSIPVRKKKGRKKRAAV